MLESGRRVLVPLLAMLMCGLGVLLRLLVLAELMVMGGLVVMMGGGMVMRGCLQMMLAGRGLDFAMVLFLLTVLRGKSGTAWLW